MDTQPLPIEFERASEKFDHAEERIIRDFGSGDTTGALAISTRYVPKLAEAFRDALVTKGTNKGYLKDLTRTIKNLDPEVLALCALSACLQSVSHEGNLRDTALLLGHALAAEAWAHKLTVDEPKLAVKIDRHIRQKHGNLTYRKQAARSIAARAGYKQKYWSRELRLYAGAWMLNVVLENMGDVFTKVREDGQDYISLTDGAIELANKAIGEMITRNPVFLPMNQAPRAWRGWNDGGPWDERVRYGTSILRSRFKDTAAAVKYAIKTGAMQPTLDALNALQSVAWSINKPIMVLINECYIRGVDVPGLPPKRDIPKPKHPRPWDAMDEDEKHAWKIRANEIARANRGFKSDRILYEEDMRTAELMAEEGRFYTPMNMDWRGRVYGMCFFNFQREDRVRAMFTFADGMEIGKEGLWWLKVHVANTGDFNKISKRPLKERVAWVDKNLLALEACVKNPMDFDTQGLLGIKWTKADKPFLFLAACMELVNAIAVGPSYRTCLPVSFDASASGLQHLSAMTRASEGSLVNLTPGVEPKDIYELVGGRVREKVEADAKDCVTKIKVKQNGAEHFIRLCDVAKLWVAFGISRKVVKRNVMTYSYSSKKFGMAEQQREDLMRPLKLKVVLRELEEHPFGDDDGYQAAKYLAGHVYDAVGEFVPLPAEAMKFLQALAKALAHEGKPLRWTTPAGLPWINRYHEPKTKRVRLWMHDRGVRVPYDVKLAVGAQAEIDKEKAANSVAPNFVHALDAAHLLLTVDACVREGITQIATVHDSFGCLAPHAARFNQIIREQFVEMYVKHDVLAEVLANAKADLTEANWHRLPELPEYGPLNLEEIKNAEFAFA